MTIPRHHLRTGAVWVLALALLALGFTSFARRMNAGQPVSGVEWAQSAQGPFAVHVEPGSPAEAAGLLTGDRLRAVDGRDVRSVLDAAELGWDSARDQPLRLDLDRSGRRISVELVPGWKPRSEPYGYLVIVGLAFWVSGLFVMLRWPTIRGGRVYAALAFALYSLLMLSHTGRADPFDWVVFWIETFAVALSPALLLHLGISLTRRVPLRPRPLILAGYAVAGLLAGGALWLSPGALGGAYRFADPARVIEAWDRAGYLALAISLVVTGGLLLKAYGLSSSVLHRGQIRWMLWGLAAGLGPFVMLYAVPWSLGADELPSWARFLAVVPMLLVPATFTAAIARYRLHDLDVLLIRAASVVTSVFFTLALYATTYFLLREAVASWLPLSRGGARYIAILLAAVSFPTIRAGVRSTMERAFYRKRYSYRATLLDWARELTAETDLVALLRHLRRRVMVTLGVPAAAVLIKSSAWGFAATDGEQSLSIELDEASLQALDEHSFLALEPGALPGIAWARYLFPMKVKGQLRAVLTVAERGADDEPLTTEDRALLITLAAQAGTAIENARLLLEVRNRAEEIERLNARQATLLESSAVGLMLVDGDGKVQAWNRTLESIAGWARADALGRRLEELLPFHVARRIDREGERAVRTGRSSQFRVGLDDHDRGKRSVNVAVSRAEDGSLVVTLDDVTERVRLEEQVLQQERLAALGMLAAGVAHEINTPLTGISGYSQMLLEQETGDEELRETLEKIESQSRRASDIANSLLTLARPERSSFEPIDLRESIEEVVRLFAPQLRGNGIRLDCELASSLPLVRGHKGKLQQVLLNLLINARDSIECAGEIVVAGRSRGERVLIEVRDSGAGIPADDLPRIFDPFFSTKTRGRGTGLGLSISYGIVQEHDGTIEVESQPGVGTTFRIELPPERAAQAMA